MGSELTDDIKNGAGSFGRTCFSGVVVSSGGTDSDGITGSARACRLSGKSHREKTSGRYYYNNQQEDGESIMKRDGHENRQREALSR